MSDTRQRLVETGFELFSRHGFHAVGLDRILADVGVTKQTFYNHFESKEDLVLDVIRRRDEWEQHNFQEMLRRLGGPTARGQLHAIFNVLHAWFHDPEFRGCLFINAAAEFPSHSEPAHHLAAGHMRAVQENLRELADAAGASDSKELAEQLLVLIQGAIVLRHVCGNDQAARIAGRMGEMLLERSLPRRRAAMRPAAVDHVSTPA